MTSIIDEIPDPERGGATRLDPERPRGSRPVDLACTGVVPERQGDKPVDPAPTGDEDVETCRQGLKVEKIDRGSMGLGPEGVKDAHPEHGTVNGVEIERGSVGLGREGVEDVLHERDSVNSVVPPRGGMDSEFLSDSDLALGVVKDADPIPDGSRGMGPINPET